MPEAAERRALNKRLSQIFRMRGLALRPDAMQPLYDLLHNDEDGWETVLHALLAELQTHSLQGALNHRDARASIGGTRAPPHNTYAIPAPPSSQARTSTVRRCVWPLAPCASAPLQSPPCLSS